MCIRDSLWKALEEPNPFIHTSTFGGNALSCVAAIAAISATLAEDLPRQAAEKGAYLLSNLRTVSERYSGILPIARGKGLLIGLQFANAALASEFSVGLLERDILVASALTNPHVIRMEPALTISYEDLARLLQAVEDTLQSLVVGAVALSRKS